MGCVLGKEVSSGIMYEGKDEKKKKSKSNNLLVEHSESLEVEARNNVKNDNGVNGVDESEKAEKGDGDKRLRGERRRSRPNPRLSNPPRHRHGEQVAAGWPSWLSTYVGEAIDGWLPRRADTFEKIDKVGF